MHIRTQTRLRRAIVAVVVLTVAALCYLDVIKWRRIVYWAQVTVFRVKRDVARDLQGPMARGVKGAEVCRQNLRMLQGAKHAVVKEKGITAGGIITWDDIFAHLAKMGIKERPLCPAGGTYTINAMGTNVRCSISANGTSDPADDHVFRD